MKLALYSALPFDPCRDAHLYSSERPPEVSLRRCAPPPHSYRWWSASNHRRGTKSTDVSLIWFSQGGHRRSPTASEGVTAPFTRSTSRTWRRSVRWSPPRCSEAGCRTSGRAGPARSWRPPACPGGWPCRCWLWMCKWSLWCSSNPLGWPHAAWSLSSPSPSCLLDKEEQTETRWGGQFPRWFGGFALWGDKSQSAESAGWGRTQLIMECNHPRAEKYCS